ncbi:MAG: hypothetical protein RLZZ348_458 [Actinomycetota bacterium]
MQINITRKDAPIVAIFGILFGLLCYLAINNISSDSDHNNHSMMDQMDQSNQESLQKLVVKLADTGCQITIFDSD